MLVSNMFEIFFYNIMGAFFFVVFLMRVKTIFNPIPWVKLWKAFDHLSNSNFSSCCNNNAIGIGEKYLEDLYSFIYFNVLMNWLTLFLLADALDLRDEFIRNNLTQEINFIRKIACVEFLKQVCAVFRI